ncbi:hypothetical protein TNCV_85581 [Trichonephila clavipes]|nr:hypothetical protein TNCV_85581 [Trichonephila clavipes]
MSEPMTVRHFYSKHAAQNHNLEGRKQCLFCFGRRQWNYGEKHLSRKRKPCHRVMFEAFRRNEKRFLSHCGRRKKREDIAEAIEEVTCGCQHFRPMPRGMAGRRQIE